MYESLISSLESVQVNADAQGWDRPSQIYFITDTIEDPTLVLSGETPPGIDVCLSLQAGWDRGFRPPPSILGFVLMTEGWRHLEWEEVAERKPDIVERIRTRYHEETGSTLSPDQLQDYYDRAVVPGLGAPSELPIEMRAEIRVSCAVLRNGDHVTMSYTRDKNDRAHHVWEKEKLRDQRVPAFLYMFLHGVRPDNVDPIQAVDDYLALKEIEEHERKGKMSFDDFLATLDLPKKDED